MQFLETQLATKQPKETGKGLSTNDFTNEYKQKLDSLENYDDTEVKADIATLQLDAGHRIELSLNNTTYVLTATLKSKAGTVLNQSTVDFPVEELILDMTYDSQTKELVITLKNGQTRRISIADIISGLVNETEFNALEDRVEANETEIEALETELAETKRELEQAKEDLDNSTLTVSATGEEITMTDAVTGTFKEFNILGNSKQETGENTPSPENPSEIKSAGDSGNIHIAIKNKNWFNKDRDTFTKGQAVDENTGEVISGSSGWGLTSPISIEGGKTYICRGFGNSSWSFTFYTYDVNKNYLGKIVREQYNPRRATFDKNVKFIRIYCGYSATNLNEVMIEQAQTLSDYTKGESQEFDLPVQEPFGSIGDIRDCFEKQNGVWYEKHNIYKYILLSNKVTGFNATYNRINITDTVVDALDVSTHGLSNVVTVITGQTAGAIYTNSMQIRKRDEGGFNLYAWLDGITNVEEAKAYLDNNEVYVEFPTSTPRLIPCTSEQNRILEEIEKYAKSYQDVTRIFSTDEVSPIFDVEAKGDINTLIENLESRIALVEG